MNISAPFIRRPVATILLTAGVALCGAAAFTLLPVAPLPRIDVPTLLVEVMSSTSEMAPRCRSKGVATVLAITSGLAPGSWADTKMAGTSMRGSGATGSSVKAAAPQSATPAVSRMVATGLRMKGAEMFTRSLPAPIHRPRPPPWGRARGRRRGRTRGR